MHVCFFRRANEINVQLYRKPANNSHSSDILTDELLRAWQIDQEQSETKSQISVSGT